MAKIIKITEEELNQIITEKVNKILNDKGLLQEFFAFSRSEYSNKWDGMIFPIISHLCLVIYSSKYGSENKICQDNLNHWKGEVFGFINNFKSLKLKNGNYTKEYNVYLGELQKMECLDINDSIYNDIRTNIFNKKEHLTPTEEEWKDVVTSCIEHILNIIQLMASDRYDDIKTIIYNF